MALDLGIPPATITVEVSILNTTRVEGVPANLFLSPEIKGTAYDDTPCLAFLITHIDPKGKHSRLLFDLAIRKDWENSAPTVVKSVKDMGVEISTDMDVADTLLAHQVPLPSIDAIIWSHWHFDHTGDPSRFPSTSKLVVGPGFSENLLPPYPTNPDSPMHESAFHGRALHEVDFKARPLQIGSFNAIDWFGDGSFYLLEAPGHATGHISGLARTTLGSGELPDSFIFMGGDVCHHAGELRPASLSPLPEPLNASMCGYQSSEATTCLASRYQAVHPLRSRVKPFYRPARGGFNHDSEEMSRTLEKVSGFDWMTESIFTIIAHDNSLIDVVDFFPLTANYWREKGWAEKSRWRFLSDFELGD